VRGELRHASTAARGAEAAALARERDEQVQGAVWTAYSPEPVGEVAAGRGCAQLLLDIGRERAASVLVHEACEEGLEVFAENTLDDATRWVPPHDVGRAGLVLVGVAVLSPDPGLRGLVQSREDWGWAALVSVLARRDQGFAFPSRDAGGCQAELTDGASALLP